MPWVIREAVWLPPLSARLVRAEVTRGSVARSTLSWEAHPTLLGARVQSSVKAPRGLLRNYIPSWLHRGCPSSEPRSLSARAVSLTLRWRRRGGRLAPTFALPDPMHSRGYGSSSARPCPRMRRGGTALSVLGGLQGWWRVRGSLRIELTAVRLGCRYLMGRRLWRR